jgi:hypothetical protein
MRFTQKWTLRAAHSLFFLILHKFTILMMAKTEESSCDSSVTTTRGTTYSQSCCAIRARIFSSRTLYEHNWNLFPLFAVLLRSISLKKSDSRQRHPSQPPSKAPKQIKIVERWEPFINVGCGISNIFMCWINWGQFVTWNFNFSSLSPRAKNIFYNLKSCLFKP